MHIYQSIKIPTNVLMSFADKVDQGYRKFRNPYHNPNHAADVAQTTHFYICKTGLKLWSGRSHLDRPSLTSCTATSRSCPRPIGPGPNSKPNPIQILIYEFKVFWIG